MRAFGGVVDVGYHRVRRAGVIPSRGRLEPFIGVCIQRRERGDLGGRVETLLVGV